MTRKKTESRIPDGFDASDLGQVGVSDNPNVVLVGQLTSPLRIGSVAEYVLFSLDVDIDDYQWEATYTSVSGTSEEPVTFSTDAVFRLPILHSYEDGGIVDVRVETFKNGTKVATATLTQEVTTKDTVLDYMFGSKVQNTMIAIGGNEFTSYELFGGYEQYINEAAPHPHIADTFHFSPIIPSVEDIPAAYLAAIVYLQMLKISFEERMKCIDEMRSILSGEAGFFTQIAERFSESHIGISQIRPSVIAKTLNWLGDSLSDEEKENQKIDIFNLLRFPKSNLKLCAYLLSRIKASNTEWASLSQEDFSLVKDVAMIVASRFEDDCNNEIEEPTSFGRKVNNIMGAPLFTSNFYGPKIIKGTVIDENKNPISSEVRVDVYWELDDAVRIGKENNSNIHYHFRTRVTNNSLPIFKSKDTNDRDVGKRLYKWQTVKLFEVHNDIDANGNLIIWHKVSFEDKVRWLVAYSGGNRYAKVEKVVGLSFVETGPGLDISEEIITDINGKFEITVFEKGYYYIRTVKDGGGYYDGDSGWFVPPVSSLKIKMNNPNNNNALWLREKDVLNILEDYKEYVYETPGKYPFEILNVDLQNGMVEGEPGHNKQTDCNTLVEALLYKTAHDNYGTTILQKQHKYWINYHDDVKNGTRLKVVDPIIELNFGVRVFSLDKDLATLNYPANDKKRNAYVPEAWTLIQHYSNSYEGTQWAVGGHMYIILDHFRSDDNDSNDRYITLEASSSTAVSSNNDPVQRNSGAQIKWFFHANFLVSNKEDGKVMFTKEWPTNSNLTTWSTLKNEKKAIVAVKLYIYDLRVCRPITRIP